MELVARAIWIDCGNDPKLWDNPPSVEWRVEMDKQKPKFISNARAAIAALTLPEQPPSREPEEDEKLGRFGHHPEADIDYEIEIDALIGMGYDRLAMGGHPDLEQRITKAMDFNVLSRPGELRWLSQRFNGTREIYTQMPECFKQLPNAALTLPEQPRPVDDVALLREALETIRRSCGGTTDRWYRKVKRIEELADTALNAGRG